MNTLLVFLCVVFPSLLVADVEIPPALPVKQETVTKNHHHLLSLGDKVVKHFWSLANDHKWNSLKKQMSKDFRAQDTFGEQFTRSGFIQLLKDLKISHVHTKATYVQKKDDVLIVMYTLSFDSASFPTIDFSGSDIGVFVKKDGKWQWKTDSNLIAIPQ